MLCKWASLWHHLHCATCRLWSETDTCRSQDHSSSSSPSASPPSSFFSDALAFFLRTRPGLPPPNGDVSAKSMCFCESRRTMKEGTLTICFPTLISFIISTLTTTITTTELLDTHRIWRCLMRTRAWWILFANPSL